MSELLKGGKTINEGFSFMKNLVSHQRIRWIIQNNLIAENDLKQIQAACMSFGIDFEEVTVIPFSSEIPEFTTDDKINIYYGATTFIDNLYKQREKPIGVFFDEYNFSIENYINKWGKFMLNDEAEITTFGEFSKKNYDDEKLFFVRPDADDKSFVGDVRSFLKMKQWNESFQKFDNVQLDENTKIIVAEPYNIEKEWRNYIVNGKVVTSSLYRKNFKLNKSAIDIPQSMIEFVEERCKEYQPNEIFVMDIALCGGDYYIIECGCMNSVGLYACDVKKLVKKISYFVATDLFKK